MSYSINPIQLLLFIVFAVLPTLMGIGYTIYMFAKVASDAFRAGRDYTE